jgi:predicted flap endonuclease-1-like 5' DNA nuclease
MVDAAMADLARASSARDDDRTHAKVQGADVEPAPPASGMEQPVLAPPIELEPATFAPTDELLRPVLAPPDEPQRPPPAPPDDLKRIKGIGAVLEKRLNGEGIFYFQQIARWRPEDVAEVSARLSAFKGRIERDRWVPQAIELAS